MERATRLDEIRTTFGEATVSPEERRSEVTGLFGRIAARYDLMNDLISFGAHRLWKRRVVARTRGGEALTYGETPAESLPIGGDSVAMVALSFGLRNMTDPARALGEVARGPAPGGALVLLEFSNPAAWFVSLYRLHGRYVIPRFGAAVARDRDAYAYLVDSIERFPGRDDITREIAAAGLALGEERAFVFGVARMHVGVKP